MNEGLARYISLLLCVMMIFDFSAMVYVNMENDESLDPLGGSPKTIWVDDDFVDDPPNHKWNTIQEGVDDASHGDTVYVFNGTYYERPEIRKIVNLTGENRDSVIIDGGGGAIVLMVQAHWVNVTGFTVKNGSHKSTDTGIRLLFVRNCRIDGNNFFDNRIGLHLRYASYNIIGNNTIFGNRGSGISLWESGRNLITGNTISNNSGGIYLGYSDYNVVVNNTIVNNSGGLTLYYSQLNIVANNNLSYNDWDGISIYVSDSNIVVNNTIYRNRVFAIKISYSSYETIISNTMEYGGIVIQDDRFVEHWNTHVIDSLNTVNGKPVYYWKNATGGRIPEGAGQVILANCTNVVVENQNLVNTSYGVTLAFSDRNTIANTTSSSNIRGIVLLRSGWNRLIDNTIIGNLAGIYGRYFSHNSSIIRNTFASNEDYAISIRGSNITIADNNISRNGAALHLGYSTDSTITNNSFLNNSKGVGMYSSARNAMNNNVISSNGEYGIRLFESYYNTFSNLEISDHVDGIILELSNNNTVYNTTISNSTGSGVYEAYSKDNIIVGNVILSNSGAIQSNNSARTEIVNNTIQSNSRGINLYSSSNYTIYHNDIIHNTDQASDTNPAENRWHHPDLLEGNCWSDYTGADDGSGVGKHAISGDGIGDTLIPHPGSDYDNYPFVGPRCQIPPLNIPPVADAGPDQTVYVGDVVQFDGSGSYDPDARWEIMTVDSFGDVGGHSSIATDSSNYPHISYYDSTNESIEYARWTGSNWSIETVDFVGPAVISSSIAIDREDHPHIGYSDGVNRTLKYAEWTGSNWSFEIVDTSGNVSVGASLALDSNDHPHITYSLVGFDYTLMYARWTGSNWSIETIGSGADIDPLALDSNDNPHLTVINSSNYLKYMNRTGDSWTYQTLDYLWRSLWGGHSIALDSHGHPHVSYSRGHPAYDLKYVAWNGSAWHSERVDNVGPAGHNSIDVDSSDNPHISYFERDKLKYAYWNGSAWHIEIVDSSDYTGLFNSLAIDNYNNPHISYYDGINDDLKYAKKIGIVSFDWDFGDGSPHGSGVKPTHVYSNPGIYNVTLTVTDAQGATDTDNCIITVLPRNQPPVADANGPYDADEGSSIVLDGSNSYDPDGDTLQYHWDLNNDGIWDTGWSPSPYLERTWGDDYSGQVALQVSDGEFTDTDTANITVRNVAPTVELRVLPIYVNVSLRIAGEKWHDVSIELYEDDVLIADGNLTRYPGSPNDQMLHLAGFEVNISKKYSAIVRYTPEDDIINGQPNGANPCWIILTFDDGEEIRLHHNFNVQHPDRYVWEANLSAAILSHGLRFEATAYDPGADDLTFNWDFGDGTNLTTFYPNDNKTYPVEITEIVTHVFPGSGSYTITLTVMDDDGGVGSVAITLIIP